MAIAATAPAYAATPVPCEVHTNFDGLTVGTTPSTIAFLPSTITAAITYVSSGQGGDNTPGRTGQVSATSTSPSWNYLEVEMVSSLDQGDYVKVNIKLSAPVENLTFTIHDIDTVSGQWQDQVIVDTSGFTYTRGANITGVGTTANPFVNTTQVDNPIASGLGDVRLQWAGPISEINFTYRAGITGSSQNQHIGIGNISFSDCVVAPGNPSPKAIGQAKVAMGNYAPAPVRAVRAGRDN